jgi:hypothetical protein
MAGLLYWPKRTVVSTSLRGQVDELEVLAAATAVVKIFSSLKTTFFLGS